MFKILTHRFRIDKLTYNFICTPRGVCINDNQRSFFLFTFVKTHSSLLAGYKHSAYGLQRGSSIFVFGLVITSGIGIASSRFSRNIKKAKWKIKAMVSLDLRNLIIPFCLLKASNAFRSLKKDDVLEILCSDTVNLTNLMKIIPSDSCELLSAKDLEGPGSGLRVRLRKSKL
jgi:TusA-related sulfurtransferase